MATTAIAKAIRLHDARTISKSDDARIRGANRLKSSRSRRILNELVGIAGATVPQIATFTGHSLKDVEAILDAHYLGRDIQLAEAAVPKLEARTKL